MDIVVRMRGGLGNQLFILAYAYSLAASYAENVRIILDVREYDNYKVRDFELMKMLVDPEISFLQEKDKSLYYDITRSLFHVAQRIIKRETNSIQLLSKIGLYYGRRKAIVPETHRVSRAYVYGYFQDADMVCRIKEKMCDVLSFPTTGRYITDNKIPRVAISIRCGTDYIEQGWPICSTKYYKNGLAKIEEKYAGKKVNVLIFSDDISKAKDMRITEDPIYVEGLSPIEQLAVMKECNDFIIANSSFSWWGALLGAKEESIVIMPNKWYDSGEDTEDVFLTYNNTIIMDI